MSSFLSETKALVSRVDMLCIRAIHQSGLCKAGRTTLKLEKINEVHYVYALTTWSYNLLKVKKQSTIALQLGKPNMWWY